MTLTRIPDETLGGGSASWATRRLRLGNEITLDVAKGAYSINTGGRAHVYVVDYYVAERRFETICFDQTPEFDSADDAALAQQLLGCLMMTQELVETIFRLGEERGKQRVVDALQAVFHGEV
jgi:hypothetical protein